MASYSNHDDGVTHHPRSMPLPLLPPAVVGRGSFLPTPPSVDGGDSALCEWIPTGSMTEHDPSRPGVTASATVEQWLTSMAHSLAGPATTAAEDDDEIIPLTPRLLFGPRIDARAGVAAPPLIAQNDLELQALMLELTSLAPLPPPMDDGL